MLHTAVRRTRRWLLVAALTGTLTALATPAWAATVPFSTSPLDGWDTDGTVYATRIVGNTVYLGGSFTQVRPPSGAAQSRTNLAALDLTTGALLPFRADTNGTVRALRADESSVWVGGAFTTIGGASRGRLAALNAITGAVRTTFSANTTSTVYALERRGSRLYVGGAFGSIKGVANPKLAAVDTVTGAVSTGFRPAPDATVLSLVMAPAGDRLYAGGDFTSIGGQPFAYAHGVDPDTGTASGPALSTLTGKAWSLDVAPDGLTLFAGLGGSANRVIAWRTTTGQRKWRQKADGDVQVVRYYGGLVYFGFHEGFAGDPTVRLLAADAATGELSTFRPPVDSFFGVWAIDASDAALAIGGTFAVVSGVPTRSIAIFHA